jgi:4-amino-4-deoxy-L-arabinose transferase-like glycosyltransferase
LAAPAARTQPVPLVDFAIIAAVFALALTLGWVGFLGSDDGAYADGALGWLNSFPYLGTKHWELRHPAVLPIALSFALFGVNEAALILPTVLYSAGVALLTYGFVSRCAGRGAGLLAAVLFLATPLFAVSATIAGADMTELFFVVASLWLFTAALDRVKPHGLLFAAGVAAGFAGLTRETAAGLVLSYGLLFLAGHGMPRSRYFTIAAGFALVWAVELGLLWAATGDPLYRLKIDFTHDEVLRAAAGSGEVDFAGNLFVHPLLNPFLVLLANQEFGLLYWLAAPAAFLLCRDRRHSPEMRGFARRLTVVGVAWFVFIAVSAGLLYLVPRYFAVTTWAASTLLAVWLVHAVAPARPRLAGALIVSLLAVDLLCLYVENRDIFFPERSLVALARERSEPIYTDPRSAFRAEFLLRAEGLLDQVRDEPPPAGAFFLAIPENAERGSVQDRVFNPADYSPTAAWKPVWTADPGRKWSGVLLERLGLSRLLPAAVLRHFDRPNAPVVAYRTG